MSISKLYYLMAGLIRQKIPLGVCSSSSASPSSLLHLSSLHCLACATRVLHPKQLNLELFIARSLVLYFVAEIRSVTSICVDADSMAAIPLPLNTVELRPPPYALDALEPHMSKETLEFHWGKHHRAYVDNLKKQIEGTPLATQSLSDIVKATYNNGQPTAPFNNAAQAWNHEFFWLSMTPVDGGKQPKGELLSLLKRDFGSFENFVTEFKQAGATQFGSGWAWLSVAEGKLVVEKSPNAINPLVFGHIPILVADVWEHAYYLDYQNRRPDYLTTFMNELVSWDAVAKRLQLALQES